MPDLVWGALPNVRDIGGAGAVPLGRVIRSPRLDELDDLSLLTSAGVRTVIDLRNADEVSDRALPEGVVRVACPVEDPSDADFLERWRGRLNSPAYYEWVLERWPGRFVAVFRAIAAAPEGAVLVHCAGGRDRTGLIVAMLLQLAGVDDDDIVADYAAGVRAMNEHFARSERPHEPPRDAESLDAWVTETSDLLRGVLARIESETYLLHHGLTREDLGAIRARLR